ncbi:hypothetical protein BDW22DRAFT_1350218 [Trametopsis cervina]|nr:hypothetical protein BDW22DRAFT_1350218 [Trametopsis cervina]
MASTIKELLQGPIGRVRDVVLLSPACKTTPTSPVSLKRVELEHDGDIIGLTDCEPSQPESRLRRLDSKKPIHVLGTLPITNLNWLSENGRDLVMTELKRRDEDSRRTKRGKAAPSNLTWAHIYKPNGRLINEDRCPKVLIRAEKAGPAVYLNSEAAPLSLVFLTIDNKRQYRIEGMRDTTYERSKKFLSRFEVLHTLRLLVNLPELQGTLLADRTPEWFAARYMEHFPHSRVLRFVQRSPGERLAPSDRPRNSAKRRKLDAITEVWLLGKWAKHAAWLVENQRQQKQRKIFDPLVWDSFVRDARKHIEAAQEEESELDDFPQELIYSDGADDEEITPLDEPSNPGSRKRKATQQDHRHRRTVSPKLDETSEPIASTSRASPAPSDTYSHHYDSDFTTDGSQYASDSDTDSLPSRDPSPSLDVSGLPFQIFQPPILRGDSASWMCPVTDCLYEIDFRALHADQAAILGPNLMPYILSNRWCRGDAKFLRCFATLVNEHYKEHAAASGFAIVREGRKCRLKPIIPQTARAPLGEPSDEDMSDAQVKDEMLED